MTFREFMQENGYDLITTFWEDFSIADYFREQGKVPVFEDSNCRLIKL